VICVVRSLLLGPQAPEGVPEDLQIGPY
jgi:hypothetical protein